MRLSFQQIILKLQQFWSTQDCVLLQPYDMEMGAGTFHPGTVLRCLGPKSWRAAYVQPCRRPTDGRFGLHPNRLQYFYQFQVVLKPSPDNIQQLYLASLSELGIDPHMQDLRFIEDDWESPSLGASGLGWEVWCNGMEISQFTYFQRMGGINCQPVTGEITYGLERLALHIQKVDHVKDISWNDSVASPVKYGDISKANEYQFSTFNSDFANIELLFSQFITAEAECNSLAQQGLPLPAYDYCIKASHIFNLLDARGVISTTDRASYIARLRQMTRDCCYSWLALEDNKNS